ncbi:MAG: LytTR family DNA-binding domain-containing protein [Oscillospiraceae bacterium]|nr:LytTR family DNA-binding domain-containing protein [Oscillospiraceae bacterium]
MNILICDDIQNEADKLSGCIAGMGHEAVAFTKGADALRHIRSGAFVDACILDIVMPDMNGIDLARKLRDAGYSGEIVFLSTSNEYGPETYEVKAFHYLLKPFEPENVKRVLDEINDAQKKADSAGIKLKSSSAVRFIAFRDIEYVEVIKHYVTFRLASGEQEEIRAAFAEIAPQLLCDSRFIQCHQSYIVNMDAIASMTTNEITTRRGARVPVSKSYHSTKIKYLTWGFHPHNPDAERSG